MIVGGVGSSLHVTVLEIVDVLLQASVAVNVLVCDLLHVPLMAPSEEVTVGVPQASVAAAVPNAAVIADARGLQPIGTFEYDPVNTGGVTSAVHVTVRDIVDVLPQASRAVKVLICDLAQVPVCAPSEAVIVVAPQPSVAVAVPKAAVISVAAGLHPNGTFA